MLELISWITLAGLAKRLSYDSASLGPLPTSSLFKEKERIHWGGTKTFLWQELSVCCVFNTPTASAGGDWSSVLTWKNEKVQQWQSPEESSKITCNEPTIVLLQTPEGSVSNHNTIQTVPHSWSLTLSLPSTSPLTTAASGWIREPGSRHETSYTSLFPQKGRPRKAWAGGGKVLNWVSVFAFFKIN